MSATDTDLTTQTSTDNAEADAVQAQADSQLADPLQGAETLPGDALAEGGESVQMFANKRSSDMGTGPKVDDERQNLDELVNELGT